MYKKLLIILVLVALVSFVIIYKVRSYSPPYINNETRQDNTSSMFEENVPWTNYQVQRLYDSFDLGDTKFTVL